jgi:fructose-bisphosphate aldolase class I
MTDLHNLAATARQLVTPGKGILAADESPHSIARRFEAVSVAPTEENRRAYRELLFGATDAIRAFISGVILHDETIRQCAVNGARLVDGIRSAGALPGIKVDKGTKPLPFRSGEFVTEGLDGLRERLAVYKEMGALFAKWRAVINVGRGGDWIIPTQQCVEANAHALALYAATCQEAGLVPIVEPEVVMEGDHGIRRCFEVTEMTLHTVFTHLIRQGVHLEGMILKPNMVVPALDSGQKASAEEVAEMTLRCFRRVVPAAVPGIVFLSGGQSEQNATANLDAIQRKGCRPWELSFSYGRALQTSVLDLWRGKPENVAAAQRAFFHRARMNGLAQLGRWVPESEAPMAPGVLRPNDDDTPPHDQPNLVST